MNNINPIWIIVGLGVIIAFWIASIYNKLVQLKNNRENAFADIDVQLKQRHDLIPQLVSTVKGYASHEEGVLTAVTKARQKAVMANTVNDKIAAEVALTSAVSGFNMQMEAYPDLKANQNFLQLQNQLEGTENRINVERNRFNTSAGDYNIYIQKIPNNFIAGFSGFDKMSLYASDKGADKAPDVNFDFNKKE